jgi:hypothetical protein
MFCAFMYCVIYVLKLLQLMKLRLQHLPTFATAFDVILFGTFVRLPLCTVCDHHTWINTGHAGSNVGRIAFASQLQPWQFPP